MLFLLLDFEKAFDRVEHQYILTMLEKVGLGGTFLKLIKGLLSEAVSKFHINGRFTDKIPVTRGVWQGCPLPLLFSLITQPLMDYLQQKLTIGEIDRVKVLEDLTIFHQCFVDDVGIFIPIDEQSFIKMQEALSIYEWASRAKLNLEKSVIVPLAMMSIPQWLVDTRCTINNLGEVLPLEIKLRQ